MGQYVARHEIPGERNRGGVVSVEGCGLGDVLGGVESLVMMGEE